VSRAGLAEAIRAAATTPRAADGISELSRCTSAVVQVFGAVAGVAYVPDPVEAARRDAVGLGAITGRAELDALMNLPVGIPVNAHEMTERELRLLRRAPRGVVEDDGVRLVRRVVAPVSVRFAIVGARTWQEGLVKAGRFAPFCARAMLLSRPPTDLDDAAVQASFYGIGISVFTTGTLRMLVEPASYVRHQHTPAQWRFAEEIYRQINASAIAAG
jgi:hypothetical protein